MAYDRAQQFLQSQKGNTSQYTPNFQPATDKFVGDMNNAMGQYQQNANKGFDQYKGQMGQNVDMMKQQVQMQIAGLQKQLSNNQAKYQTMADNQKSRVDRDYKQMNEQIDNQTFNQMKYNSAMGQQRGVSSSAQQQAMDTHTSMVSSGLFNQNSQKRSDSYNDIDAKLMEQLVNLDNEFTKSYTDIMTNSMNQQMAHNAQMAGKELEFSTAMADKILGLQVETGKIQFETKIEEEKAKKALAQQIMQMTFSDLQSQDNRNFQADEAQKGRDFQASENAKDRALQQALASMRGSGGSGGSGSGSGGDDGEAGLFWEANYQYAMEMMGMTPNEATDWASKQVRIRFDSKNFANETKQSIDKKTGGFTTQALFNKGKSNYGKSATQMLGGTDKKTSSNNGILGWFNNPGSPNSQKARDSMTKAQREAIKKRKK